MRDPLHPVAATSGNSAGPRVVSSPTSLLRRPPAVDGGELGAVTGRRTRDGAVADHQLAPQRARPGPRRTSPVPAVRQRGDVQRRGGPGAHRAERTRPTADTPLHHGRWAPKRGVSNRCVRRVNARPTRPLMRPAPTRCRITVTVIDASSRVRDRSRRDADASPTRRARSASSCSPSCKRCPAVRESSLRAAGRVKSARGAAPFRPSTPETTAPTTHRPPHPPPTPHDLGRKYQGICATRS